MQKATMKMQGMNNLEINPFKTNSYKESSKIWQKVVARDLEVAIIRDLATVQGLLGRSEAGIFNKKEDSLCGCFVAIKLLSLTLFLVLSNGKKRQNTQT